jgi:DNA-binding MarR family transcriptional regulator
MSTDDFYARPGHLIRRLNQIAVALFLDEIGPLDLTPRQYTALTRIEAMPGIDQATLSNLAAMDKTTIVKIVERLVDKGLITRDRSKTDRRTNHLNVTEAGSALLKQVRPLLERSDQRILAPLSPADQRRFMDLLAQLVHTNNLYSRAPMNSDMVDELTVRSTKTRAPASAAAVKTTAGKAVRKKSA